MTRLPDPSLPLAPDAAAQAFDLLFDADLPEADIAAFLVTMARRGESAVEIAAAARAMRARMITVGAPDGAIDVCGTGGDGHHTLNVSTAVSLVVAAAGVPVAKHGNRAASSKAGAADTLEALGLDLDRAAATAEATLADLGICFLFAQNYHPALKRLGPIRKAIGERTIFNLMGPLANPARVRRQLIGIARPAYVPIYAQALADLGVDHAMIISGDEGLDELSLASGNDMAEVKGHDLVAMHRLTAAELGLSTQPVEAIRGGDAAHNAAALRALLQGEPGAYRDAVLLNAAAALVVADAVPDLREGVEEAAETIDRGLANALLNCWIAYT
ncbi:MULTISPECIES: anthranilate phosphoribosyltransferase [Sphingomonas]|uniref:Anthranilate phosphoribosyltransferase n=1 Tax=Sphingomonas bisphenolicum TaxID=296544 RepID=A0ABM7G5U0_9SPHN|nr:anthranilate phosphoribosyltransferase [Sphingomonas bisphenolicum]MBA4091917.1 anthranilate phosphoribosyltransferase [Sphingobium sp.]BBF70117.1 anthranilate phosphoribosyltransferase [Sphingomonas bisphenolicum]